MGSQEIHSWTLGGLIGAFIDLAVSYFLLCGSAIAFFASKLSRIFALCLPCPCKGSFGYRNSNFWVHKVLFEWPSRKVCSIQVMAGKRFPFDLVGVKCHSCNHSNGKMIAEKSSDNRLLEFEDEASCSSCSGPRLLSLVDKESRYDAKGKRNMSLKRNSGMLCRRRINYDCGKFSLVFPSENSQPDVSLTSCLPYDGSMIKDKSSESTNPASRKEVSLLGQEKYSSSLENYMSNVQDKVQIVGNEENRIKMLEDALEEQKAAYAALYLELEKERAAAATAADEAMAMISRLQEEKASMEMETRQYQRMIEERVAYDEEEMNILQEILLRRERENHFLEKELEAYRQMGFRGSDKSNGKSRVLPDEEGQRQPISLETNDDPLQTESTISIVKKDEISNPSSSCMVAQTCFSTEDGENLEKNTEHKDQANDNLHSSFLDIDPDVLDVHAIDDKIQLREEENEKIISSSFNTVSNEPRNSYLEFGSLPVQTSSIVGNYPTANKTQNDTCVDGLAGWLSMFCNPGCKTETFDSQRDSSCAENNQKLKIGTEIEILGERLRMVQHEKEKLTLVAENEESERGRLKLLEEIENHLRQIKQLRNPMHGASLPPSSAKAS